MSDHQKKSLQPIDRQRGRGRPRVDQPLVPVSAWIHPQERDRLSKLALRRRQSESSLLRHFIVIQLGDQ